MMKAENVVLDTGAFIRGQTKTLHFVGCSFFTTPESIGEIRDTKSRERLATLPFDLEIRSPSDSALKIGMKS